MNAKQWAVVFVAMMSFEYASATLGFFEKGYTGVSKSYDGDGSGYYGWMGNCRCNKRGTRKLDGLLSGLFGKLGGLSIDDNNLEEYELRGGQVEGFDNFERKGPYRCSMSRDYVRIYFRVGFVRLLFRYKVTLLENVLGGFLGGIASLIGNILGNVSNFLLRFVCPDVGLTVILRQRLGGRGGLEVERINLGGIDNISFLGKRFSRHGKSLGPYFRPVADHGLRGCVEGNIRPVFKKKCSSVVIEEEDIYSYSETQSESYEYSNDVGDEEEE